MDNSASELKCFSDIFLSVAGSEHCEGKRGENTVFSILQVDLLMVIH